MSNHSHWKSNIHITDVNWNSSKLQG